MAHLGIAIDLGTSGFRAQSVDITSGKVISTIITNKHPLGKDNIIDQMGFCLENGLKNSNEIIIKAINKIIREFNIPVDQIARLSVCGNSVQLSLFQNIDISDLAYTGKRKLRSLGVSFYDRNARIAFASDFPGLDLPDNCEIIIPPAIKHQIGADALALIIQTGLMEKKETTIAIDFGANAEMALFHNGTVITGSAAAGPALEGRQIKFGKLAEPWVICDLVPEMPFHRLVLLNDEMLPIPGDLIDLSKRVTIEYTGSKRPTGITGTGTISIVQQGLEGGLISLPHIKTNDKFLHLGNEIYFTENDLIEAGKAFGAIRAGYITLCHKAGIAPESIKTAYLSGASGTYMDAQKAQKIGIVPPGVETIYQIGNNSLVSARNLILNPDILETFTSVANKLRKSYIMFAASVTFKKVFILELSYWTEGMPFIQFNNFLKRYDLPELKAVSFKTEIIRTVQRDIDIPGESGIKFIDVL